MDRCALARNEKLFPFAESFAEWDHVRVGKISYRDRDTYDADEFCKKKRHEPVQTLDAASREGERGMGVERR